MSFWNFILAEFQLFIEGPKGYTGSDLDLRIDFEDYFSEGHMDISCIFSLILL